MAGGKLKDGIIKFAGANTPGWISNLGISYGSVATGVFAITAADGTALSPSNPGWVTVPSTTAGRFVTLKVTSRYTFYDDAHASSDLGLLGFGITEAAAWAQDMPFFIYVVNKGNTDLDGTTANSAFFISRNPSLSTTSSTEADIHDTAALSANDTQLSILVLAGLAADGTTKTDMDNTDYESLPCQLIGAIRMRWSTVTDDWTVQALGNSDGLGEGQLAKTFANTWTFPAEQNGAAAGTHFITNGGTAPTFTTPEYKYKISRNGIVKLYASMSGNTATDGAGAVQAQLTIPYAENLAFAATDPIGSPYASPILAIGTTICAGYTGVVVLVAKESSAYGILMTSSYGGMVLSNYSNADRSLSINGEYQAF